MNALTRSEHYGKWAEGLLASYVARPKQRPEAVAKTITTAMRRGRLSSLDAMHALRRVEEFSVQGFQARDPGRRLRFNEVKRAVVRFL